MINYEENDDEKSPDFNSVGLYIAGLQIIGANVACCVAALLTLWVLPSSAVSAVRTLSVVVVVALLTTRQPIRVGRVRGIGIGLVLFALFAVERVLQGARD